MIDIILKTHYAWLTLTIDITIYFRSNFSWLKFYVEVKEELLVARSMHANRLTTKRNKNVFCGLHKLCILTKTRFRLTIFCHNSIFKFYSTFSYEKIWHFLFALPFRINNQVAIFICWLKIDKNSFTDIYNRNKLD